ncbi:unnamed protein product [Discosporangium mesarthrocarpum]
MRNTQIEGRKNARELAESEGFIMEDYHVTTADGFVLVMQRIIDPCKAPDVDRPPVLLMHGLMQDSEALLCGGRDHALGLRLCMAGFDVFCGNNRGNRYSHKHLWHGMSPSSSDRYWDFCIDELARYDMPAMVDKVLATTGKTQLCYIGFSQGTAQAFAALSSNQDLCKQVSLFVALSPAARAKGLSKSLLLSLVQANLRFLYLLFGRRRMLPMVLMWQRIMSRERFIWVVDAAMGYLFSWKSDKARKRTKLQLYPHIYSFSSVKCVMHWFQMIDSGRLAMFSDSPPTQFVPVTYDLPRVTCPMALVYGGSDHLVEVGRLAKLLPNVVMLHRQDGYEHLDTMWGDSAKDDIFPKVEALIREHCS